jgi:hypothetical protein
VNLPVGDSREDNPPNSIWHNKGLNYYYQGRVDNCVMGGLINAVFWMIGPNPAKNLLKDHSPALNWFWFHFVKHVNGVFKGHLLK